MNPHQFYLNLADNDNAKCEKLVQFSHDFINGNLRGVIYVIGRGNNGKCTLVGLLRNIVKNMNNTKLNTITSNRLDDMGYNLVIKSVISDIVYCILDEPYDIDDIYDYKTNKAHFCLPDAIIILTTDMFGHIISNLIRDDDRIVNMRNNLESYPGCNMIHGVKNMINLDDLEQHILDSAYPDV